MFCRDRFDFSTLEAALPVTFQLNKWKKPVPSQVVVNFHGVEALEYLRRGIVFELVLEIRP